MGLGAIEVGVVVADADASLAGPCAGTFAGPLAGICAGLQQTRSDWLLSVPCDAPRLPTDLAARLAAALAGGAAELAVPVTADGRIQPVFCLLHRSLRDSLAAYLAGGDRQVERWLLTQKHRLVPFEQAADADAFFNANSLAELRELERHA